MEKAIQIKASAKINLFLDVLGKRQDGYHNIKSLLMPISLYDTIKLESRPHHLSAVINPMCRFKGIRWPFSMGNTDENLIMKAARQFRACTGCRKGVLISMIKRIPIGAGLGGGSADAAAVLKGLNRLWKTGLSITQLTEIGARIGCDVPALIRGGAIYVEGRGEDITPVDQPLRRELWILLIYPGFSISTADIYRRYNHQPKRSFPPSFPGRQIQYIVSGLKRGSTELIGKGLFNALQQTVFQKYPLLEMIKKCLEQTGVKHVLLTGSGSTVFVLLKNRNEGENIAKLVHQQIETPLWTQVVHTIGKQEVK